MKLEDELACARLSSQYAVYADRERHRVADLFTEDAVLMLPGNEMRGREAIRGFFLPRPKTASLHFCTNILIEEVDTDHARGVTYLLSLARESDVAIVDFPQPMPTPKTGGTYHDEFARTAEGWLFSSRRLEPIFSGRG